MSFNQRFEDMDRLRLVFLALDKSNDGRLTLDEIHEGLVTVMGRVKGNLKEFQEIMREIDKDGDGLVDYSEFLAAAVNKAKIISDENLRYAFSMLDHDKNGYITKNELKEVFDSKSSKDDELWDEVIREVDNNRDGTIDFEEFSDVMNRLLQRKYHGLSSLLGVIKMKF
jgi:Ca2+-binding EF-hand superfamily protein